MSISVFTPPFPAPAAPAAQAGAQASAKSANPAAPQTTADPATALQNALAALRQTNVTKQDGLSVLMANALRAVASGNLPPQVQSAVQQLMAMHLPSDKVPSAADIKAALTGSGLFTESGLAKSEVPQDLKTALGQLNQAAKDWSAKTGGNTETPSSGTSVPPPMKGGSPIAQPAASPTLPKGADAAMTAKLLADDSEAAVARQELLQLASLPEPSRNNAPRYVVDVPLMTPQGATVAQLVIERDSHGSNTETPQPVWRVGLALNIEPLGPVRANLALSGDHAWVSIAAERPETLAQLQKSAGWLNEAFTSAALDADIAFVPISKPQNSLPGAYRKSTT